MNKNVHKNLSHFLIYIILRRNIEKKLTFLSCKIISPLNAKKKEINSKNRLICISISSKLYGIRLSKFTIFLIFGFRAKPLYRKKS